MFDFVRKHTKIMQFLLFLLIFPSFVLFGIDGYNRMREKGATAAKVDGQDITQSEWDAAHRSEIERLRAQMPNLDAKLLDSPEAHYATLDRLVHDRVLAAAANRSKLTASDQRLARELQDNPTIGALRRPDGTLDMERYRQLLGSQGMTPEMFEAQVRNDLSTRQVVAGIVATGFATKAAADAALGAYFDKREVQVALFKTADYAAKLNPGDAEIDQYFREHAAQFQAPEEASIEYLVLDQDALKKNVVLSEQDLKTYFEQNAARLSIQEERRASHILIGAAQSAPAAERQKAKARAEELLAQVKKSPDSFAELAKQNSQDPGSAAKGGDLDFITRGAMVKPFEDAVFALKKGDISEVVETEFGYHIIKLTDIKAPRQRSFEEMKPEIEAELRKQQAQRKFAEVADAFTNGVFEQSDTLKGVAERLQLEIKTASHVMRRPAPGASGVLANPKFLNALFSADAVEKKRNTEAVETGSNQLVSGRIAQYTPARTLPLAEVKDKVREQVLAQRGAELAKKEGAEKLAAWKANPAGAALPAAVDVSRDQKNGIATPVVEAAMRTDAAALPVLVGVDLGAAGYAVLRVNKVLPRPVVSDDVAAQDRKQYAQWWSAAENQAYYNLLKERFKTQIQVAKPAAANIGSAPATLQ